MKTSKDGENGSKAKNQISAEYREVFTRPKPGGEFGEGIYERDGKYFLLADGGLSEISVARAFQWVANYDHTVVTGGDEEAWVKFLKCVAALLPT